MKLPSAEISKADLRLVLQQQGERADERTVEVLDRQIRLLARWNARYHLTRIDSWHEILDRHVRESLLPLKWIDPAAGSRLLDVGSGNGFPAIPILACRPSLRGVLAERSERKALFLDAVIRECGMAGASVENTMIGPRRSDADEREPFDLVISRATLPPEQFLALAETWVRREGLVFMYAADVPGESAASGRTALRLLQRQPIEGRIDSHLFVLQRKD